LSLEERIEKVKAKLAVAHLSNRDALEARLADIETQTALGDRPKALPARVKWMEARLEQNPDQPKLQARLERLQTKLGVNPAAVDREDAVPVASSSADHRLIHLDARIRLIEQRLVDPNNCPKNQHNASLVTKLRNLHSTKEKLLFGKWRRTYKSKTEPTEDRSVSSLDRRMDYLHHNNRGHHETAAEVAAFTTSTEKVIVEQVRDMKLA
jgi:hypothetical protein